MNSDSKYGSGAMGGTGFGNKSNAATQSDQVDVGDTRYESEPIGKTNSSIGSAGFGNKSSSGFNKQGSYPS